MKRRTEIGAADLFVLIDREFRRRRSRACAACHVPFPYRVDAAPGEANWEVELPADCGQGCAHFLEELVHGYKALYRLKEPEPSPQ